MRSTASLIAEMHTDLKWVKQFIETADKRYAKRWVEKLSLGAISLILVAFLGALVGLVFIQPVQSGMAYIYLNLIT